MRYRRSLRFRILAAFVGSGLVLGPLLAWILLTAAYQLEELGIQRVLSQRLEKAMRSPADARLERLPGAANVDVLGGPPASELPAGIADLAPGFYETEFAAGIDYEGALPNVDTDDAADEQRSWYLAVGHSNDRTIVATENITALEYREWLTLWTVGGGTLLAVYFSLWMGYYLSRRLIEPVRQLASAVAYGEQVGLQPALAASYPNDEVGELAAAVDHYRERIYNALSREREFSAHVSHELRNPLAVIHSALELTETEPRLRPGTRRAIARAQRSAAEMAESISTLLLLARESTRDEVYPAVAVAEIVERLVNDRMADAAVSLRWERMGNPMLAAPEIAIRTIAANLIGNALQNTPAGQVTVNLDERRLAVIDTGVGIPTDELPAIRERGRRASNARAGGNGVGLALVDRLCATFGWQVTIRSEVGRGTTVEWWFS